MQIREFLAIDDSHFWIRLHIFYRIRRPGLDVEDVKMGTQMLIRSIQISNLADNYWSLQSKWQNTSSSPLSSLFPFIDSFGL